MNSAHLMRVAPGALVVGKPLPWAVYDDRGNVLLKQGYVIQNDTQLEQLFERGLFHPRHYEVDIGADQDQEEEPRERNPFADYGPLLKTLSTTITHINERSPDARERLLGLARFIVRLCRQATDPCLALVHLYSVQPDAREQLLFYAILCSVVGDYMAMDEKHQTVMVAAALTGNLALQPFLDKLNRSNRRLSEDQRAILRKHPQLSAQALENAGVDNRLLLAIVMQHHEEPDGSGHPQGLRGEQIRPEARALALAERYMAMITKRPYRERLGITKARELLASAAQADSDQAAPNALLKALTDTPPGALVRLANQEIAVVTKRPLGTSGPEAQAIISPDGYWYMSSSYRDCSHEEYAVMNIEMPDILPPMDFAVLWGYGE
ncbi:HD domain-containing protein [Tamilnaduibacter salinus]|uniref:HD domain-containing protein n=1 Tax=Tamilnaduibacter salinus TaxID=1484056 RepID=A0A2U1CX54_9GAMM|nr:HD domain-containing phosphohydrolase [Tamilnaduibacter salinus]PVY76788.1 HD domain-containing protein [Tamilnaduibacter salinus]